MPEENIFEDLIRRVRHGDAAAAEQLVQRYEPAIRRAARIRLADSRMRRLLDSMDICQSVFASFFCRAALGQYDLDRPEHLLRLLVTMARKKVAGHVRIEQAAKRDNRRIEMRAGADAQVPARGVSPERQVAARELLAEVRARFSAEERHLADQRAAGMEWAQIALNLGSSPDALRKQLTRAVDRIAQELGLDEPSHV